MRSELDASYHYDRWLVATVLLLLGMGIVMVASASMVISDRQFGQPLHYLLRQGIYLGVSLTLMVAASRIPMVKWKRISVPFLFVSMLLLLLVLIPGVGHSVNGSRRWLKLGIASLQVSELMKFAFILYMARYLRRFEGEVQTTVLGMLKPLLFLGVIAVLLLMEPDFGATVVMTTVCLSLLFVAGARLWPFIVLIVIAAIAMGALAWFSPYRLGRITTFLNPWHHAFDSGYQLTQSLIAFGRGGWLGVGLGNSVQKLFYLPEAHTDFLFAVIVEELGLLGAFCVMALFTALVVRIFQLARRALGSGHIFSAYVCFGAAVWIGIQALINVGVCAGALPTKGLTLPFMSYGGSSLLVSCLLMGVLLRVAHEEHKDGR